MEFYGAFLDQEWEPLNLINMFSIEDNYNLLFPTDQNTHQATFEPIMDFRSPAVFSGEVRQLKDDKWCEEQGNAGEAGDSPVDMQLKRKLVEAAENDVPKPPKKISRVSKETCSSEKGESNELISRKSKASKGSATDSQSIYARKRRERINERLKILQTLVPNGTKVDISTMLEEAVDYVKFLQLQIKLLSSDDTWMYAPIAYNGMDMGLYQKIIPNL